MKRTDRKTIYSLTKNYMNFNRKKLDVAVLAAAMLLSSSAQAQTPITLFPAQSGTNYHRIPSIARLNNGNLTAYSDLRINGSGDVGYNAISVVGRTSSNDGATWTAESTDIQGNGSGADYAHGDAATVVDRESGKILLMTSTGKTGWPSSTRENRVQVGHSLSADGGVNWTTRNCTEQVYQDAFDKLFFSSGRIIQSTVCKTGKYYRIYSGVNTRPGGSRVAYSDDFGATWHYLGGIAAIPAEDGDECKVEELPSGDILLSCRRQSGPGRYFNVFVFTDRDKGEGSWGKVVTSGDSNIPGQTFAATCNGEILLVPALRASDNTPTYVLLQSAAASTNRENVSIYYKELPADYTSPSSYLDGWGKYQVSTSTSCYSTMVLDKKGDVAFLYEENANGGYDIVFKSLPLSTITGNAYRYQAGGKGRYITTSEPTSTCKHCKVSASACSVTK